MMPVITRIFRNGRNQVVRIPVALSLDAETVTIERQGDTLLLRPLSSGGWDRFFADPSLVLPPDFEIGDDPPVGIKVATVERHVRRT